MSDRVRCFAACAVLAALCLAAPGATAKSPGASPSARPSKGGATVDESKKVVDKFVKGHSPQKADETITAILARVAADVPAFAPGTKDSDPWLESLRAIAASVSGKGDPPERQTLKKVKSAKSPAEEPGFPLPTDLRYRFGDRVLAPVDADAREARRVISALRAGKGLSTTDLSPGARLTALLHGAVPELEIAIAQIERELDIDDSRDEFQRFLESWRNGGPHGDESFYEALDRTAGSKEAVFFYDAMLADFVSRFGGEEAKRWSLGAQHAHNQDSFLTLRQYRGMIEATALALTLPPDVAMPERLSRYDYGFVVSGKLSYRDELDLRLEDAGGDARKVVQFVKDFLSAHKMPTTLWEAYDPLADFHLARETKVSALVMRKNVAADELAKQLQTARNELAAKIATATRAAIESSP